MDASYLSESRACSRAGGYLYLFDIPPLGILPPMTNGVVLAVSSIMDQVLSSATDAEIGADLYVMKENISIQTKLEELGHTQLITPIECDNQCAEGILEKK